MLNTSSPYSFSLQGLIGHSYFLHHNPIYLLFQILYFLL